MKDFFTLPERFFAAARALPTALRPPTNMIVPEHLEEVALGLLDHGVLGFVPRSQVSTAADGTPLLNSIFGVGKGTFVGPEAGDVDALTSHELGGVQPVFRTHSRRSRILAAADADALHHSQCRGAARPVVRGSEVHVLPFRLAAALVGIIRIQFTVAPGWRRGLLVFASAPDGLHNGRSVCTLFASHAISPFTCGAASCAAHAVSA